MAFLRVFFKNGITQNCFIYCLSLGYVLSKIVIEKIWITVLLLQLHKAIRYFKVNFVRMSYHSKLAISKLCVTKTAIIYKLIHFIAYREYLFGVGSGSRVKGAGN
jgi:hypothetical protein